MMNAEMRKYEYHVFMHIYYIMKNNIVRVLRFPAWAGKPPLSQMVPQHQPAGQWENPPLPNRDDTVLHPWCTDVA